MKLNAPSVGHATALVPWLICCSCLAGECRNWLPGYGPGQAGMNDRVTSLAIYDSGSGPTLYASGFFSQAGGAAADRFVRWTGTNWQQVGPGGFGASTMLVHDDGSGPALFIGGGFNVVSGVPYGYIVKWDGTQFTPVGGGMDNNVDSLAVFDEDGPGPQPPVLIAGGSFTTAGGVPANRIARWDGTQWSPLGSGCSSSVNALAVFNDGSGDELYVGGDFSSAGGVADTSRIARWTGSVWESLGNVGGSSPAIRAMAVHDDGNGAALYVGGVFSQVGGNTPAFLSTQGIARWNGSSWAALGSGITGTVNSLTSVDFGSGSELCVGGNFEGPAGEYSRAFARWKGGQWSGSGAVYTGTSGNTIGNVMAMLPAMVNGEQRMYLGGNFTRTGPTQSRYVALFGAPCTSPVITQQPANLEVATPNFATFTVTASGSPDLTYQWRRNEVPITNTEYILGAQTPQLQLLMWSLNDEATYDCQVTNSLGTTTSDPAALTVFNPIASTPVILDPVIIPPQPVPDRPELEFRYASSPLLTTSGDIVMNVSALPPSSIPEATTVTGAAIRGNGELSLLLYRGDQAPGFPDGVQYSTNNPRMGYQCASGGRVVYSHALQGPGVQFANSLAMWYRTPDGIQRVVRQRDAAPGFPEGVVFETLASDTATSAYAYISESGEIVFPARLSGPGITLSNMSSIWRWTPGGTPELVLQAGQPAPGTAFNFHTIYSDMQLNGSGAIAFDGTTTAAGALPGIWSGTLASPSLVALTGNSVPGAPMGTVWSTLQEYYLNAAGKVAFSAYVGALPNGPATGQGLWEWDGAEPVLKFSTGGAVPGAIAGTTFLWLRLLAYSDSGAMVFSAQFNAPCSGQNCATSGVFVLDSSGLHVVALNYGTPPPGMTSAWRFDSLMATPNIGPRATINANGQAILELPVIVTGSSSRPALYGWTTNTGLFPIAVPGTQVETIPGQFQTCSNAALNSPLHVSSIRSAPVLRNDGFLTYRANIFAPSQGGRTQTSVVVAGYFNAYVRGAFPCPGDANQDQQINAADLSVLLSQFGQSVFPNTDADLNGDGLVNAADLSVILGRFGQSCD